MSHMHFPVNLDSVVSQCQETPCSEQVRYLKFKWLQQDSNPQPLNL